MEHPALTILRPSHLVALSATCLVILVSLFLSYSALFIKVSIALKVK